MIKISPAPFRPPFLLKVILINIIINNNHKNNDISINTILNIINTITLNIIYTVIPPSMVNVAPVT